MDQRLIERVTRPREGDSTELAEIRAWLAKQSLKEKWGLTPATRVAYLLDTIDTLQTELQRWMR